MTSCHHLHDNVLRVRNPKYYRIDEKTTVNMFVSCSRQQKAGDDCCTYLQLLVCTLFRKPCFKQKLIKETFLDVSCSRFEPIDQSSK